MNNSANRAVNNEASFANPFTSGSSLTIFLILAMGKIKSVSDIAVVVVVSNIPASRNDCISLLTCSLSLAIFI